MFIYGLERQNIKKPQMNNLGTYYRSTLSQLHSLPQHVAKEAIYLLVGVLLLEVILHIQTLNLFPKPAKDQCSLLYQVALGQLSIKDTGYHSCFIQIVRMCTFYELPTPQMQPTDNVCKYWIKKSVISSWETDLKDSALSKSLRRFLICSKHHWSSHILSGILH